MKLGVSSLAYCVEYGMMGNFSNSFDLLYNASKSCLEYCENNNINVCELVIDPPDVLRDENKDKFIEMVNTFKKITKQVHGPFVDMSLCSHNAYISKASIDAYIETAHITREINAKILTIHPGLGNFLIKSIKQFNIKQLAVAVSELLDAIKDLQLTTCIENMPKKVIMLEKIKDFDELFSNVNNREDLFITYDTSHLWTCSGNVERFWKKFHDRIKNVHVVDNSTKESDSHPALGAGKINFKRIFDVIKNHDYNGALIVELSLAKTLDESISYIKKLF